MLRSRVKPSRLDPRPRLACAPLQTQRRPVSLPRRLLAADFLADRLMIDAAVILLWQADRLPWVALAIPVVQASFRTRLMAGARRRSGGWDRS